MDFINIQYERVDLETKGKVKYKVQDKELFAEETAIHYYQENGYVAIWTENSYWWHLLGLLFWDVIFAKVDGSVVVSSGRTEELLYVDSPKFNELFKWTIDTNGIPADFFTSDFYRNRDTLVKNRIKELLNADITIILEQSYKKNFGKNFRMIENWNRFTLEQLKVASTRLTNEVLIKIMERILKNITDNRAGFPDLIVYNDAVFFLSEVKSEKDKLSDKQKEWHGFLASLGVKVQLCLINHTDRQVANMEKKEEEKKKLITISFGNSTSKKREEAIEFAKKQPTYFTRGEGKDQIHGAIFDANEIEDVYTMLDLTSGWKSQRIEIEGKEVKSTELRSVLWCFREKNKNCVSNDYCRESRNEYEKNNYGCRMIALNIDRWTEYGYISTDSGDWIFDKKQLEDYKTSTIDRLSYCPLFNAKKIENVFEKLPDMINPINDKEWAYISNSHHSWFSYNGKWIDRWGNVDFPGVSAMIGIERITKKGMSEAIKYSKSKLEMDRVLSMPDNNYKSPKKKAGCFIATAVYESYDAPEVVILRKFRDKILNKSIIGRIFIKVYYTISPSLAKIIKRKKRLKLIVKNLMDKIVKRVICINER